MNAQLRALFASLGRVDEATSADLHSRLRDLPQPEKLPSPWATWTLICLVRHRRRALWAEEIIRTRLNGVRNDLAQSGAFGHPNGVPQHGSVPGMSEWEYFFHGRGCLLSHKVLGETIDVDYWDDSAEYIEAFFFTKFLDSQRQPEPPEERLRELHRRTETIEIALDELLAIGALIPFPGNEWNPFRVSPIVLEHEETIDDFCSAWGRDTGRIWLGGLCGDWLSAHGAAVGRPDLVPITAARAQFCRANREQFLQREIHNPKDVSRTAKALYALSDLGSPDLDQILSDTLVQPMSRATLVALEIICENDNSHWLPAVFELFGKIDVNLRAPIPMIWITALRHLFKHQYRVPDLIAALPDAPRTVISAAVLLAIELAPHMARPLIRKGLQSALPVDRNEVAAILALINEPWSRRELIDAMSASADQNATSDIRAALMYSCDAEAERAVLNWEQQNPHADAEGVFREMNGKQIGPCFTFSELTLKNRSSWLQFAVNQFRDQVMPLRHLVPPDAPRHKPWWRFWSR